MVFDFDELLAALAFLLGLELAQNALFVLVEVYKVKMKVFKHVFVEQVVRLQEATEVKVVYFPSLRESDSAKRISKPLAHIQRLLILSDRIAQGVYLLHQGPLIIRIDDLFLDLSGL